jgi:hypothetical protein
MKSILLRQSFLEEEIDTVDIGPAQLFRGLLIIAGGRLRGTTTRAFCSDAAGTTTDIFIVSAIVSSGESVISVTVAFSSNAAGASSSGGVISVTVAFSSDDFGTTSYRGIVLSIISLGEGVISVILVITPDLPVFF